MGLNREVVQRENMQSSLIIQCRWTFETKEEPEPNKHWKYWIKIQSEIGGEIDVYHFNGVIQKWKTAELRWKQHRYFDGSS